MPNQAQNADGTLIYEFVDVEVAVDDDGDVTIYGDGGDYLNREQQTRLRDALNKTLSDEVRASVPIGTPVLASEVSFNEGIMRLAGVHEKTVTFSYAKGNGAIIETRRLVPSKVEKVGPDQHLTVTGYDPDRDEVRAYRLDRVRGEIRVAA